MSAPNVDRRVSVTLSASIHLEVSAANVLKATDWLLTNGCVSVRNDQDNVSVSAPSCRFIIIFVAAILSYATLLPSFLMSISCVDYDHVRITNVAQSNLGWLLYQRMLCSLSRSRPGHSPCLILGGSYISECYAVLVGVAPAIHHV